MLGIAKDPMATALKDQFGTDVIERIAREIAFDPDLWVLEFESPDLLPPFAGTIV